MCIIAYGKKGDMTLTQLRTCMENNPDGFFLLGYEEHEKTPHVYLRTFETTEVEEEFKRLKPSDNFIFHARIRTHGSITMKNIHGWEEKGWIFCHNGVLHIRARGDMTDSETFFKDIFIPAFGDQKAVSSLGKIKMVNAIIGTSKMVFFKEGKMLSFGKFLRPDKEKDVWFSNNTYLAVNWYPVSPPQVGFKSNKVRPAVNSSFHYLDENLEYELI